MTYVSDNQIKENEMKTFLIVFTEFLLKRLKNKNEMKNMLIVFAEYFQNKDISILFIVHMPKRHQYLKDMALKDENIIILLLREVDYKRIKDF
jgi:hypothetical protein